jgi:hypothetical protein
MINSNLVISVKLHEVMTFLISRRMQHNYVFPSNEWTPEERI